MQLPTVSGANLERQTLTFPADFSGEFNLVFIAFQQWQQMEVDSWAPLADALHRQYSQLDYYEFPTIQKMNWLSRTFINEGMRAGIPNPATRRRTVTLYIDKGAFRRALNIVDERHIQVLLFDRQGMVLWRETGPLTPEKESALHDAIERLMLPTAVL